MTTYPRMASMLALSDPRRKGKELVMVIWESPHRLKAVCFCSRSQKYKDGGCRHIKTVLAGMKSWYRARTRIDPFRYSLHQEGPDDLAQEVLAL